MKIPAGLIYLALSFLALAAALSAIGALWAGYAYETRGIALGADLPILQGGEPAAYGINAALQAQDDEARRRSLSLLQDGGYAWVRQPFPWRDIEPAKGEFNWARWDALVRDYRRHGLRVVAVLDRPPAWSREDNNWPNRPPDRFEDFAAFAAAFATHYRGQVDYLQIWDEPNIFPNWGNRPVDPVAYASLLKLSYGRIKQANPAATVLLAGLAPNVERGGRNMSDLLFLAALYRAGAAEYFDIAAAKPYGFSSGPDDRRVDPARTNFARLVAWRELMVANGDQTKPIWAVEFGWNALPPDWAGRPSLWGDVTPAEQAAYTAAAWRRARSEWPWLPVLFLQGYLPDLPAGDPKLGFSITDAAGRPRPVYAAVRDLAAAGALAGVGFRAVDSPSLALQGDWAAAAGRLSAAPDASLRLRFLGSRLDLVVVTTPSPAAATVSIDGRPANRLPLHNGSAVLDGQRDGAVLARVTVADRLAFTEHELELTVIPPPGLEHSPLAAPPELALSGFFVVREPDYGARPWLTVALVLVALLLCRQTLVLADQVRLWAALRRGSVRASDLCRAAATRLARRWRRLPGDRRDIGAWLAISLLVAVLYVVPLSLLPLPVAALLALACIRPTAVVFALLAAAPLGRVLIPVGSARFAPSEVLAVVAAVVVVGRWLAGHRRSAADNSARAGWLASAFGRPIVLFVTASAVAALFAAHRPEAFRELRTVIVEPLVLYVLVLGRGRESATKAGESGADYAGRLIDALVLVGGAVALVGLYQYLFTDDVITAEGVRRLRAFYGSPNNAGLFLGRIIPLAACIAAGDPRRRWYAVPVVAMLVAVALTFSLGAWTGVVSALLLVVAVRGSRVVISAATGALTLSAGALAVLQVERVAAHFSLDRGTTQLRLLIWQAALNMLRDHPLLGVGPDNFLRHYRETYMLPEAWPEPNLSHPHNFLLDFWLRTGLLGLLAGLWLLARFFAVGIDLYRRLTRCASKVLVLGLLASMLDFIVHGLVDNSLFLTDLALVFWLSCAVLELLRQEHYNTGSVR